MNLGIDGLNDHASALSLYLVCPLNIWSVKMELEGCLLLLHRKQTPKRLGLIRFVLIPSPYFFFFCILSRAVACVSSRLILFFLLILFFKKQKNNYNYACTYIHVPHKTYFSNYLLVFNILKTSYPQKC